MGRNKKNTVIITEINNIMDETDIKPSSEEIIEVIKDIKSDNEYMNPESRYYINKVICTRCGGKYLHQEGTKFTCLNPVCRKEFFIIENNKGDN